MVVSCIAHPEQVADVYSRLAAAHWENIFEEKVAADEILFAIRTDSLKDAHDVGGLLYRVGVVEVDIDVELA